MSGTLSRPSDWTVEGANVTFHDGIHLIGKVALKCAKFTSLFLHFPPQAPMSTKESIDKERP